MCVLSKMGGERGGEERKSYVVAILFQNKNSESQANDWTWQIHRETRGVVHRTLYLRHSSTLGAPQGASRSLFFLSYLLLFGGSLVLQAVRAPLPSFLSSQKTSSIYPHGQLEEVESDSFEEGTSDPFIRNPINVSLPDKVIFPLTVPLLGTIVPFYQKQILLYFTQRRELGKKKRVGEGCICRMSLEVSPVSRTQSEEF